MSTKTKDIEMQAVTSSQPKAIGHDKETNVLRVKFNANDRQPAGAVYDYAGVDEKVFSAFKNAPSIGRFFGQHIRGVYSFNRVS